MEGLLNAAAGSRSANLPKDGTGVDMGAATKQANQLWEFLDELAERDPEAYKRFVSKQAAEAKASSRAQIVPEPAFCVCFSKKSPAAARRGGSGAAAADQKLYVNVCSHKAVEKPLNRGGQIVDDSSFDTGGLSIPLVVSPLRRIERSGGGASYEAVDVIFNPWVASRCEGRPGAGFRVDVVKLALSWIEQELRVSLNPKWTNVKAVYKGGHDAAGTRPVPYVIPEDQLKDKQEAPAAAATSKAGAAADASAQGGGQAGAATGDAGAGAEEGLTDAQRAFMRAMGPGGSATAGAADRGGTGKQSAGAGGKPLISEVTGAGRRKAKSEDADDSARPTEPPCTVREVEGGYEVVIELEGVHSMQDISLESSETTLRLAAGRYRLERALPGAIDPARMSAKFRKKRQSLVVKMLR